jgi:hypothetical protein
MYIIYGSEESLVFYHESYLRECDGKSVKVIMGKAIQTCIGLNREFTSCLLDWRLREPIGGSVSLMGDNRFLNYFLKYVTF